MEDVESGLSLKKRVGGFFAADGGGRAVTGVDDGLGRERENFFLDASDEKVPTSAR